MVSLKNELSKETPLFEEIMKVHGQQREEVDVEDVILKPFEFSYSTKPFTLKSRRTLVFKKGEMVLVRGESTSGKSTLFKVLCGDIDTGSNQKVRTVHFSGDGSLGCQSILQEITLGNLDPEKLICILKGVHLYDLFLKEAEGKDVLTYLDETRGGNSTGTQDRLCLARTLYNLDNCSLVLIDEPIGGLDIETARKIIRFIKEYAVRRCGKAVAVTTHQYQWVQEQFDKTVDVERNGCESNVV